MELLRLNEFADDRPPADPGPPSRDDFLACLGITTLDPNAICVGRSSCLDVEVSLSDTPGVSGGRKPAASLVFRSVCLNFDKLIT